MQKVRIFIASSSEVQEERHALLTFISRQNERQPDIYLETVMWESYIDQLSQTRIQDEYIKAIEQADIFVMLLFTKVGRFTLEEFENAFKKFKEHGKPLIYIYFKESKTIEFTIIQQDIASLVNFQKRLSKLKYYYTKYHNADDLVFHFNAQLEKIIAGGMLDADWQRRIKDAKRNRSASLNLSGCNLSEVPEEISKLTWLTELDLSNNRISQLNHLQNLTDLVSLSLNYNKLSDLGNLPPGDNLEELDVSSNQLSSLAPVAIFKQLKSLHAKHNRIEDILSLEKMHALKLIALDKNQIKSIRPLLYHIKNNIEISFNYTTDKNEGIFIKDNPLSEPPEEIILKGNAAVEKYFNDLGEHEETTQLNIIKLILVGNSTVGKTNLGEFLQNGKTEGLRKSTNLLDISTWEPAFLKDSNGHQIKVIIFDFGGQDYYHDAHRMYYSHDTAYILLWDTLTDNYTPADQPAGNKGEMLPYENFPIPYWLESINFNLAKRAAANVQTTGGTAVSKTKLPRILIIQNKIDLALGNLNQAVLSKKYDNIWGYFNLSLLKEKRTRILEEILKDYFDALNLAGRTLLPYQMKIVKHFFAATRTLDIYPSTAFLEQCRQIINDINVHFELDDADTIAQILNNTGIIFYDRNSVSDGMVYTSIKQLNENIKNIMDKARQHPDGTIKKKDVETIDHYSEMMALLCKNKSIVQLNNETWLTIQFLPPAPGPFVEAFLPGFSFIQLRFVYDAYYHKSVLLNLYAHFFTTASQGQPADKPLIWQDGMILIRTDGNKRSMVFVEFKKSENGGIINVRTSKPFSRYDFEKEVEKKLEEFNDGWSYKKEYSADNLNYFSLEELQKNVVNKVFEFSKENKKFGINDFKQMVQFENLPKRLFISYSSRDAEFMQRFITHLEVLKREGLIDPWYDRMIESGTKWDDTIRRELERADVIVFLLSPDFLATQYIFDVEIEEAIKLQKTGDLEFFFIELRSCNWKLTKLKDYQQTDNSKEAKKNVIQIGESSKDEKWMEAVGKLENKIKTLKNKQPANTSVGMADPA